MAIPILCILQMASTTKQTGYSALYPIGERLRGRPLIIAEIEVAAPQPALGIAPAIRPWSSPTRSAGLQCFAAENDGQVIDCHIQQEALRQQATPAPRNGAGAGRDRVLSEVNSCARPRARGR